MEPAGPSQITAAAARLASGQLVAFPTETVYGLGADALNPASVAAVYALKGRPSRNPLIVHVADVSMARTITAHWPDAAQKLAERFWPGPLTIIVPKADAVPEAVTAGSPNVAVRCPDHPVALALLRAFNRPLVGPSANPSGRISPTAAAHVRAYFAPQQVMVLEGGACRSGIESTVISIADTDHPSILRPGVVSAAELTEVLGRPVRIDERTADGASLASPGLLPAHYAPLTPAFATSIDDIHAAVSRAAPRVAVLAVSSSTPLAGSSHEIIRMPGDAAGYARNLYAALMRADAARCDRILIELPAMQDGDPLWVAVRDRLSRATSQTRG